MTMVAVAVSDVHSSGRFPPRISGMSTVKNWRHASRRRAGTWKSSSSFGEWSSLFSSAVRSAHGSAAMPACLEETDLSEQLNTEVSARAAELARGREGVAPPRTLIN